MSTFFLVVNLHYPIKGSEVKLLCTVAFKSVFPSVIHWMREKPEKNRFENYKTAES
jgi:hypothetical protein